MAKVSAIILAAGLSRRMGSDNKLFLSYNGKTIIEWVIDNISNSQAYEIIIVASELSYERLKKFTSNNVSIVNNFEYKRGMTSSIQAGVQTVSKDSNGYMVCLGDQPTLDTETYNQIINAFSVAFPENKKSIVVPFYKEVKGNPVTFSSYYNSSILNHTAPEGCKEIIDENKSHLIKLSIESNAILNDIDTKDDYDALVK
ncbi:MAG: nucleotidyltransferase family protein [Cyclobacteriaceae bacterium]|nr:nucleotidyltransferase family protein [Cyclobacteriaceae bacterium]